MVRRDAMKSGDERSWACLFMNPPCFLRLPWREGVIQESCVTSEDVRCGLGCMMRDVWRVTCEVICGV